MATEPTIQPSSGFVFGAVDPDPSTHLAKAIHVEAATNLGPLAPMAGSWSGTGFNTIFRPQSTQTPTKLPIPAPGDNVLELNLTQESTTFTPIPGTIPNRGLVQGDIALTGMTYLQQVTDVTTSPATGIHIEPGIWAVIPPTTDPSEPQTVCRMASIPHGTTVNAQGVTKAIAGAPVIPGVNITPINLATGAPVPPGTFPSQTATSHGSPRIPQNLAPFIAEGTITQAMLDDPTIVLKNVLAHEKVLSTTEVSISTQAAPPVVSGGGVDNIAFLANTGADFPATPTSPNARTFQMTATFYLEEVEVVVTVPAFKLGDPPVKVPLVAALPAALTPTLLVDPGKHLAVPTKVTLRFHQIQYAQVVTLNFNGLGWPHASVATLVPAEALTPIAFG